MVSKFWEIMVSSKQEQRISYSILDRICSNNDIFDSLDDVAICGPEVSLWRPRLFLSYYRHVAASCFSVLHSYVVGTDNRSLDMGLCL